MKSLDWLFGRKRRYDDLAVSISEHIDERAEELESEGMSREIALLTARREFGNVGLIRERSREAWQWSTVESILADLRLTLRRLKKSPGFAITVLLTLAIGMGANTTVFSVLNGVLLKPLPYPDSSRLVALWLNAPGAAGLANFESGLHLSSSMYFTFSEQNRTFASMGVWIRSAANVTGLAQPEEVHTVEVTDGVLQTLGVPAAVGRWLTPADQDPRGARRVMLSYGYWQRRFGGNRGVIGQSLQVDAHSREIVGVMPRGFRMVDADFDLLVPLAFDRNNQKLAGFGFDGVARLKPGVTVAQADADIARMIPMWMNMFSNGPGTNPHFYEAWKIAPNLRLLKDQVIGNIGSVLWVVMGTVGLVMLIACTNVANLLLVRADARRQELSIRAALGAGRGRIARELLVESVFLGMIGGVMAVGVAYAGLRLLVSIGPAELPRLSEISLDASALVFTFGLAVFSGLLFGSIPALKYARARATAVVPGASRTASVSRERQRSRNVLVIAQVAMALVLLVCALLMIRTFAALRSVDPGFADADHVQTMRIFVPGPVVLDPTAVTHVQNEIADKLAAIPGVSSVGFAWSVPMENNGADWDQVMVEGKTYRKDDAPLRLFNAVSPGYFHSMGTKLIAGRDFDWTDAYRLRPVAMVSENFARESWGSASAALGKRLHLFKEMWWVEVVGVVQDVHENGVDEIAPPTVYWPAMTRSPYTHGAPPEIVGARSVVFTVHSAMAGNAALLASMQQAVWSVNANLPLAAVRTMGEIYAKSMARTSFTLAMLAIAGSMALLLGIIGIYGVISYGVSQRRREIGIRLALGARKSELKWMFVRAALLLTASGVAIGIGTAALLTRLMKSLLFNISPLDPVTYLTVPVVLVASAALASYLPARRAAQVDPVDALRAE